MTCPQPPATPQRRLGHSLRLLAVTTLAAAAVFVPAASSTAQAATGGTLSVAPGSSDTEDTGLDATDAAVATTFTVPNDLSTPIYLGVRVRAQSDGDSYLARVRIDPDGSLHLALARSTHDGDDVVRTADVAGDVAPGQLVHLEARATGSNPVQVAAKAWRDGDDQPSWQVTYADDGSGRITGAGSVLAWSYLSHSADDPRTVRFSDTHLVTTQASSTETGKPSASTTGVPEGTELTRHDGDITVTKDGTHLDGLDIHGFVNVRAANVTISNSIVRGGRTSADRGLIQDYGYANLTIDHVLVQPEFPSVYLTGIKGSQFTASHVHIVGGVDSMEIFGDNVTVEDSLLENTEYYTSDPAQHGGPSHSDNIQTMWGKNVLIQRNTIRGTTNFAVLGGATLGDLENFVVRDNWVDGGHCTVKLQILNGHSEDATVTGNKFGPDRAISNCPFQVTPGVDVQASGNTFEQTGLPVSILWLT